MTAHASSAALVIEYLDTVWNAGKLDDLSRYVAEGYTIHLDPRDPWEGRTLTVSEVAERVRSFLEQFPGRFTVHEILASESKVMIAWLWGSTVDGDLPGDGAREQSQAAGATVYYIDGGKLAGHWQVTSSTAGDTTD